MKPRFKKEGVLTFTDLETGGTLKVIDTEFADTPEEIHYGYDVSQNH